MNVWTLQACDIVRARSVRLLSSYTLISVKLRLILTKLATVNKIVVWHVYDSMNFDVRHAYRC